MSLLQIRIQDALDMYQRMECSFGRAVELAGVNRETLIYHARAAGVEPIADAEMLAEELA